MKIVLLLVSLPLIGFTSSSYAVSESYQTEIVGSLSQIKNVNQLDQNVRSATYRYFFTPIKFSTNLPFAEVAQINRISSIEVNFQNIQYEDKSSEKTTYGAQGISGIFYSGDLFITGSFGNSARTLRSKSDTTKSIAQDFSGDSLGVGYYFTPSTYSSFTRAKNTSSTSVSRGLTPVSDSATLSDTLDINTRLKLQGDQSLLILKAFRTQVTYEQPQRLHNTVNGASATYYPYYKLFFNFGYGINRGDVKSAEGESSTYGAGFSITPQTTLSTIITKFRVKDNLIGYNSSTVGVALSYRY